MADDTPRAPTVFLSYASEDRDAARRIGAALPGYGLEVWYDESELGGGDAWDQKIRRQIRECDYFMALISAQTESRREGYFRREWRLASERTLDMADDHAFILPLVIDDTEATRARVPEKFQTVQWLKVPNGEPTPAFEAMCRRLATGATVPPPPRASIHPGGSHPLRQPAEPAQASAPGQPSQPSQPSEPGDPGKSTRSGPYLAAPFPVHQPGQSTRFYFAVIGWLFREAYHLFRLLPRWIRYIIIVWAVIAFFSHGNSHSSHPTAVRDISPEKEKKLQALADKYSSDPTMNLAKLATVIGKEFDDSAQGSGVSVLAQPFTGPPGDEAATKLADTSFAQAYTRISVTKHARLIAGDAGATTCALDTLLERGRAKHAKFVLCGVVDAAGPSQALAVTLADVRQARVFWTGTYPVASADPKKIAVDVAEQVPKPAEDDDD